MKQRHLHLFSSFTTQGHDVSTCPFRICQASSKGRIVSPDEIDRSIQIMKSLPLYRSKSRFSCAIVLPIFTDLEPSLSRVDLDDVCALQCGRRIEYNMWPYIHEANEEGYTSAPRLRSYDEIPATRLEHFEVVIFTVSTRVCGAIVKFIGPEQCLYFAIVVPGLMCLSWNGNLFERFECARSRLWRQYLGRFPRVCVLLKWCLIESWFDPAGPSELKLFAAFRSRCWRTWCSTDFDDAVW
jgi:hypothetical protein